MKRARSRAELLRRLAGDEIVPLTTRSWAAWRDGFTVGETVATALGGTILVVRWPQAARRRWGIVEESAPDERVVRPLPDAAAVKALVRERLAAYERMWDG